MAEQEPTGGKALPTGERLPTGDVALRRMPMPRVSPESAAGALAVDGHVPARPDFDTNMDILPAKRVKEPEEPEEEKPMSKRKKRKLEQLAKKHAGQEMRSSVLAELRAVQLTSEQSQLMRASQSTCLSRRDKVAFANRRIASGVPLSEDMQRLGKKKKDVAVEDEDNANDAQLPAFKLTSTFAPTVAAGSTSAIEAKLVPPPAVSLASGSVPGREAALSVQAPVRMPPTYTRQPVPVPATAPSQCQTTHLRPVRLQRTALIEEQRSKLPAVMCEQEVVEMVLSNDVTLVSGDTGCGKSTQIPQFLYEAGVCDGGNYLIGVTQPRRVAAISVSQRVGDEVNEPGTVGYQVRYDRNHCSKDTRIKFMTDGILLRELQADFLCSKYAAIVIDEAHERGVNCDILIGLLSRAVQQRRRNYEEALAAGKYKTASSADRAKAPPPPLRLVIMSATLRVCDFTENQKLFPRPPPVVKIDARTFPVTVHFARSTEEDYIKAAHRSVLQINKTLPPGTILVFVTGKQEVIRLCHLLRRSNDTLKVTGADEEVEEEDGGEIDALQGSDDEDIEFDDDLAIPAPSSAVETPEPEHRTKTRRKKQQVRPETAEGDAAASAPIAAPSTKKHRKVKKRRKLSAPTSEQLGSGTTPDGETALPKKLKKKKKRKAQDATPDAALPAGAEAATTSATENSGLADTTNKDTEEIDVSYRIDAEEDVVMLDAEAAIAAEDVKDLEARRQKREKMVKLDKSRTAGGVFQGAGFGEGPVRVFPLFAQLAAREQLAAFSLPKEGERNIIVSTNVAETSVTLPNVRYVVDTGREKRRKYKASSGVSSFVVDRIAKSSANQRAGRAGRLGPGHSYRLYSAAAYENHMTQFAPIAVLHVPMDPVLLLIASLGVPYLDLFPWPTPPPAEAVTAAMTRLQALGALAVGTESKKSFVGRTLRCTQLGFRLASLPVAPRYAKMLLSAVTSCEGSSSHVIGHACALVAAFSVGNLVSLDHSGGLGPDIDDVEPEEGENELLRAQRDAQKRLREAQGKEAPKWTKLRDDAEGLLWLMGGYAWAVGVSEAQAEHFCRENRANSRQMSEAHSLMQQLGSLLQKRLSLGAAGVTLELPLRPTPPTPAQAHQLKSCIVHGLIDHIAVAKPELGRNVYICKDLGPDTQAFIHVSSNTFRHRPRPTVMAFNEIISSSSTTAAQRHFMRDCVGLDPMLLSKRAAEGDCSLLQLGEFLAVPAPRYLKDKDSVLGFVSPVYVPLGYILPTVEVEVPADTIFRYKVFAKALLDGEVLNNFPASSSSLLARPSLVLHSPNNPRVMGIVGPLWEHRIGSRASLLLHWEKNRQFLLEGYLKWLPQALHDDTRMSWPPLSFGRKRS